MITSGEGRTAVWAEKKEVGKDLLVTLGGGERTHIGGVVVCEPGKEAHVVRLGNHYDVFVLQPMAEKLCGRYSCTVVCTGGIHIDDATKEEIEEIKENCWKLLEQM